METKMGLDMYLTARKSFFEFYGDADKAALEALNSQPLFKLPGAQGSFGGPEKSTVGIQVDAMYWRKANHIHLWFVQNVQKGDDDCGIYDVSPEQLAALRDACKLVLDDHAMAPQILPTQSGFFFGSTDYGEYYFQDCQETLDGLDAILANDPNELQRWEFFYSSSW
jgi:hypothetical protein